MATVFDLLYPLYEHPSCHPIFFPHSSFIVTQSHTLTRQEPPIYPSPFPPPHQPLFWRGSHTPPSLYLSSAVLSPFFVPPCNPATNTQKYTPTHSSHSPPPAHLLNYSCEHVMSLAISVTQHQDQHVDLGTVVTGWMGVGVWYNTSVRRGCNHF